MRAVFLFLALCLATLRPLWADELSALARLDPAASRVVNAGDGIAFDLAISQGVPYRAFVLADPARLVMDFAEVDFTGATAAGIDEAAGVTDLGWGPIRPGWSRLVATLDAPYAITSAEERVARSRPR